MLESPRLENTSDSPLEQPRTSSPKIISYPQYVATKPVFDLSGEDLRALYLDKIRENEILTRKNTKMTGDIHHQGIELANIYGKIELWKHKYSAKEIENTTLSEQLQISQVDNTELRHVVNKQTNDLIACATKEGATTKQLQTSRKLRLLSILAVIAAGIGGNLVTQLPPNLTGVILIIGALAIEVSILVIDR